jgi:hypothetical protein
MSTQATNLLSPGIQSTDLTGSPSATTYMVVEEEDQTDRGIAAIRA